MKDPDWLKCPHCGYDGEICNFPDLFYNDPDCPRNQYKLLIELWRVGFNLVTCGECGQVFIHRIQM